MFEGNSAFWDFSDFYWKIFTIKNEFYLIHCRISNTSIFWKMRSAH